MATIQEICQEVIPISEISKVCNSAASTTSVETNSRDSLSPHIHHQVKETMKSSSEGYEMGEVREENGRLKLVLSKMLKDYKSLQQHIHEITAADTKNIKIYDDNDDVDVVLSLGRPSSSVLSAAKISDQQQVYNKRGGGELDVNDQTFALHLDCKHDSAAAGSDNQHQIKVGDSKSNNDQSQGKSEEEETVSKDLRRSRTGEDDDQYLKNPPKKARVSVRAICNAPTMNDGCQWRKYGQKIAKGNPCPRAYYRCTISASCPVRKHVQRCPEDMSVLVTTYEGSHDHPLPPSATAMASTTSAAVSMLKASSTTSTSQQSLSLPSTTSIHTLNSQRPPFYLPNTTISTSHTHPTVTLDLTAPTASSRYNKYASTFLPSQPPPYNSSTNCLNFSAPSSSSSSFEYWNSRPNHSVTSSSLSYNGTQIYQPYYNMPTKSTYDQVHQPQYSIDNIAAATKEITSNPNFQSAVAAAISSIVGKSGGQRMEPSLDFGYTSYLNRTSTVVPSNSQTSAGNIKFVLPFGSNEGPFVAGSSAEKGEYKM